METLLNPFTATTIAAYLLCLSCAYIPLLNKNPIRIITTTFLFTIGLTILFIQQMDNPESTLTHQEQITLLAIIVPAPCLFTIHAIKTKIISKILLSILFIGLYIPTTTFLITKNDQPKTNTDVNPELAPIITNQAKQEIEKNIQSEILKEKTTQIIEGDYKDSNTHKNPATDILKNLTKDYLKTKNLPEQYHSIIQTKVIQTNPPEQNTLNGKTIYIITGKLEIEIHIGALNPTKKIPDNYIRTQIEQNFRTFFEYENEKLELKSFEFQ